MPRRRRLNIRAEERMMLHGAPPADALMIAAMPMVFRPMMLCRHACDAGSPDAFIKICFR